MPNYRKQVDEAAADVDFSTHDYQVHFETTQGTIRLNLDGDAAPGHCRNMIGLARVGFYDGVTFHRIIPGFMIQGGCPQGTGTGGPGYQIEAEFNDTPHEKGVLSAARSRDPDSAGSQFFVCLDRHPHLDGQYTAYGRAADDESMEVVRAIGSVATDGNDRPRDEVRITAATVVATAK